MHPASTFDLTPCLAGDRRAWSAFVGRYSAVVYTTVRQVMRLRRREPEPKDCERLALNVFVRLVKSDFSLLRKYDPARCRLDTYLMVIARSTALDFLRFGFLNAEPLDDFDAPGRVDARGGQGLPDVPPGVLTDRQQLVMHLLFAKNYAVASVAAVLGVSPQTVRSLKHEAVKRLRRHFQSSHVFN
jgi:DNA-directed RNA polymerase specialized sigma24 family protein